MKILQVNTVGTERGACASMGALRSPKGGEERTREKGHGRRRAVRQWGTHANGGRGCMKTGSHANGAVGVHQRGAGGANRGGGWNGGGPRANDGTCEHPFRENEVVGGAQPGEVGDTQPGEAGEGQLGDVRACTMQKWGGAQT